MRIGLRCPNPLVPSVDALERLLSYGCRDMEALPALVASAIYPPAEAESILIQHLTHADISLVSWACETPMVAPAEQQAAMLDELQSVVQTAARVKQLAPSTHPPVIVVRSGSISEFPELDEVSAWRMLLRACRRTVSTAAELGLQVALLPKRGDVLDSPEKTRRLLDELECDALGVCLDPAYIYWEEGDLESMFQLLGPHVLLARLKDLVLVKERQWLKGYRPFGKGQLDVVRCLELLQTCPRCISVILDCIESSRDLREVMELLRQNEGESSASEEGPATPTPTPEPKADPTASRLARPGKAGKAGKTSKDRSRKRSDPSMESMIRDAARPSGGLRAARTGNSQPNAPGDRDDSHDSTAARAGKS